MNMSSMMGIGGGRMPDFSAMREKLFSKADANADQTLSLQEFQEAGKNLPMGKGLSADKAKEAFGKIDSDGNGSLSQTEMRSFTDTISSQMQSAMIDMQALMGSSGKPDIAAMFGRADSDRDGGISRAEFDKAGQNSPLARMLQGDRGEDVFGSIDSDSSGSLSQDEMAAFGDTMKETMKGLTGSGQPADFNQAVTAYRQGSDRGSDLTSILLKALDGNAGSGRGKTA